MKLKPVVASLVMLGLMSPVLAKNGAAAQQAVIDQNSVTSQVCTDGWFNRIKVGGIGSVVGIYGDQDQPGTFGTRLDSENKFEDTGPAADLYVNNFNLLLNADLSSWSKATLNLAYSGAPQLTAEVNENKRSIDHRIFADELYVTIADFAKYPFYLTIGKKYVPFGDYKDAYTPKQIMSPAQMFSQINAVTAVAGAATDFGFYGSVFAFRGQKVENNDEYSGKINNFGAKLGYQGDLAVLNAPSVKVNFAAGYLDNIKDIDLISEASKQEWKDQTVAGKKVNAVSLHGDFAYKAFTMYADWVSALKDLNSDNKDSKFWGANVNGAYAFKTLNRDSSLGAGFQWSGNATSLTESNFKGIYTTLPKWRLVTNYKINLFKNTDLDFTYAHGKSYDLKDGDKEARRSSNVGIARLMVQF